MYASELLSVLLQASENARKKLNDKVEGTDMLLRSADLREFLFVELWLYTSAMNQEA